MSELTADLPVKDLFSACRYRYDLREDVLIVLRGSDLGEVGLVCCICVLVEVVLVAAARFHYTVDMITKLGCSVTGLEGCLVVVATPTSAQVRLFGLPVMGQLPGSSILLLRLCSREKLCN